MPKLVKHTKMMMNLENMELNLEFMQQGSDLNDWKTSIGLNLVLMLLSDFLLQRKRLFFIWDLLYVKNQPSKVSQTRTY